MNGKIYRLCGIEDAIFLLRPKAKWQVSNNEFTLWDDPRPCPSMEEIYALMKRIKEFEDSIPTIWLKEDLENMEAESNLGQK